MKITLNSFNLPKYNNYVSKPVYTNKSEQKESHKIVPYDRCCNFQNQVQFTSSGLPNYLPTNNISITATLNETGKSTTKLSQTISTALYYLEENRPLILCSNDRSDTFTFLNNALQDRLVFPNPDLDIDEIMMVTDDRMKNQNEILFIKRDNKIFAYGNFRVLKEDKSTLYNDFELTEIFPDTDKIIISKFNEYNPMGKALKSGLRPITFKYAPSPYLLGTFINNYKIDEVLSKEFVSEPENKKSDSVKKNETPKTEQPKTFFPLFSDIGGNKEAITQITEDILVPMAKPDIFGHRMNKGTILEGPSGTGKSMLGDALANELSKILGTKVSVHKISGVALQDSPVGGSEKNWRELFEKAKENQPSLIIIDEIEGCIPQRDGSSNARYDNAIVNQILSLTSNLEKSDDNIHIIGMTNNLKLIDEAMLRPGRFGNVINVPEPNKEETGEIFDIVTKNIKFDETLNKEEIVNMFFNKKSTGAVITGIMERAKKYALRRNNAYIEILNGNMTKEDVDNIKISMEDIKKAFADEDNKNKTKKQRPIIKGFHS